MATLGALFGGSWLALRGGDKKQQTPPINASSKDEEQFIQYVFQFFPPTMTYIEPVDVIHNWLGGRC